MESDDDSWGADDEPVQIEKPEKSTVSTSVTATTSNCHSSKVVSSKPKMSPKPKSNPLEVDDFDNYDFSSKTKAR